MRFLLCILILATLSLVTSRTLAFEGVIAATLTKAGGTEPFRYTAGSNHLHIECLETNHPQARNIITRRSGETILLFPHNRTFMRLRPELQRFAASPLGFSALPLAPVAGLPPSSPADPPAELQATTNRQMILGYLCTRYSLQSGGESMEIWATDQLIPFAPYVRNQYAPNRQLLADRWSEVLQAKGLFPLRAVARPALEHMQGLELFRFEVNKITAGPIRDPNQFQLPPGYREIQSLPF